MVESSALRSHGCGSLEKVGGPRVVLIFLSLFRSIFSENGTPRSDAVETSTAKNIKDKLIVSVLYVLHDVSHFCVYSAGYGKNVHLVKE